MGGVSQQLLLGTLTPGVMLGAVFMLVIFGRLVPLSMVKARLSDKDAIITDLRGYVTVLERNNAILRRGNTAVEGVLDATREVAGANDQ